MKDSTKLHSRLRGLPLRIFLMVFLAASFLATASIGLAGEPLDLGWLDFSYGEGVEPEPTGEGPESKLWWNDGFWWGSLYNPDAGEYRIHRLIWATQTWEDTGVALDDREDSKADTLWDAGNNKLYVASHFFTPNSSEVNSPDNWARLYRYSYDATTQTYSLDSGFPVTINEDKTETLALAKDSTGRLWIAYVSRDPSAIPSNDYQVYVNTSAGPGLGNDDNWETPFVLPVAGVHVAQDDIAAIVAYAGNKIGVMWSNQSVGENKFYFAQHTDGTDRETGWTGAAISVPGYTVTANDHISLKAIPDDPDRRAFAAIKLLETNPVGTDPLMGLVQIGPGSNVAFYPYSTVEDKDTRPLLVLDEGNLGSTADDKLHFFVTGNPAGSQICYKSSAISAPGFNQENCGTSFIQDDEYDNIWNPTSTKQAVNQTTGLVVLASDDSNGRVYVHNVMGTPPPAVTHRSPAPGATDVLLDNSVTATFSKLMNAATLTTGTFTLEDSNGQVAGSVSYDAASRTATFTPSGMLQPNTVYTATLTSGIEDTDSKALYGAPKSWSFTTGTASGQPPTVRFSSDAYSVNEAAGTATITVILSAPFVDPVTVQYASSNGTAAGGQDYTPVSDTLTFAPGDTEETFTVSILPDAIDEPDETVNLALSAPSNATLGNPSSAVLTIADDDATPTVQFSSATYSVDEDAGSAEITVNLSAPSGRSVEVDYTTANGTASAGSDYESSADTLMFAPGETSKTITIDILDDSTDEPDETVNLALSNPGEATLGTPATAVLTIVDDDTMPSVRFSATTYNVAEDAGAATVTVQLSGPSTQSISVDYATSNGSASAGSDYQAASGTLTFAPGETSKTFTVTILDDSTDEPDETVNLTLSNPSNAGLGTPSTATLSILDNDGLTAVEFSRATYAVDEFAGSATITVRLRAASGQTVTVDYSASGGSANAGEDYEIATGTLSFAPGETSKTFTVTILDDSLDELDETISLALSNPTNAMLGTPATAVLTILDDDQVGPPSYKQYLPLIRRAP